jgi:hypothetical protein
MYFQWFGDDGGFAPRGMRHISHVNLKSRAGIYLCLFF